MSTFHETIFHATFTRLGLRTVLPKPLPPVLIFGTARLNQRPEGCAVVQLPQVTKFMHDYVINPAVRRHHQSQDSN